MKIKKVVSCHLSVVSILLFFLTLYSVLCTLYSVCYAQPVPSSELINHAKEYDGKTIVYDGEVIGDIMVRGQNAWVNVHDGQNALGVWIDKDLTKNIFYTSGYKSRGDIVEVVGVFHRACPQHGADLDIHAQKLRKIQEGNVIAEEENILKRNLAITLIGALCLVLILRRLKTS